MVGGDFNLSRFCSDKNNGRINQRFADCFNDWVNRCGLVELNPCNRKFTWSNDQCNPVMARLDRIFVSTCLGGKFPLAKVTCLAKEISDHTPPLVDSGDGCQRGQKCFKVEKWWLEKPEFKEIVVKAWNTQCDRGAFFFRYMSEED
jgi:hypothetical protein